MKCSDRNTENFQVLKKTFKKIIIMYTFITYHTAIRVSNILAGLLFLTGYIRYFESCQWQFELQDLDSGERKRRSNKLTTDLVKTSLIE